MTGFGEGTASTDGVAIEAKIRTVNHSGLSVRVRGLRDDKLLQHKAEQLIKDLFSRGRIEVQVSTDRSDVVDLERMDMERVAESYDALEELVEDLGLENKPTLGDLISLDLFENRSMLADSWPALKKSLERAAEETLESQAAEGNDLREDLLGYIENMNEDVEKIEGKIPTIVSQQKDKLKSRIEDLLERPGELDSGRLEQEFATVADKLDVSEELSRARTHLESARSSLIDGGVVGKKLKFLGQELQREINTLGAKAKDGEVQTDVIDLKLTLEKFKEQARNVA
ncbi:MAG: YicC family protein [Candidatus Bipolaricaulota bacterium]